METAFLKLPPRTYRQDDSGKPILTQPRPPAPSYNIEFKPLAPETLDFRECKACNVVMLLDYCHAGKFIRDGLGIELARTPPGLEHKQVLVAVGAEEGLRQQA